MCGSNATLRQIALTTFIFRPHVDADYCYRQSNVVCLSATIVSPAKVAELVEMPFGLWTLVGSGNYILDGGPDPPCKGAILRGKGPPVVKQKDCRELCENG